jgi:hypothetical protein
VFAAHESGSEIPLRVSRKAHLRGNCSRDTDENSRSGNHRVTRISHDDNTYTITVAPTGAGFQSIMFRRLNPSAVLRFVTADGKELEKWDESAPPNRVKNEVPPGTRIIGPNGEIIQK